MIAETFIEAWRQNADWQMAQQVEQDLVISRALVDLYNHPEISQALVFRGGTALNKLFINPPSRYSEDIDFVQQKAGPIGSTIDAIRETLHPWLGTPKWKMTQRSAKLIYPYETIENSPAKLKIEINTTEHFQVLPLRVTPFSVTSAWFTGKANIVTYEINELIATKLRALYQRRKGRDLFDLWYVVKHNLVDLDVVFDIFQKYCAYNKVTISGDAFISSLAQKRDNRDFKSDMKVLLPSKFEWRFEEAYSFVLNHVISKMA